jgi:hypothetical protein
MKMSKKHDYKFLKLYEEEFNTYVLRHRPKNLNTKEGLTHAMNQFLIEKLKVPKELEEVFTLFIFPGKPVSRWAYKYRFLPYMKNHIFPQLDVQMLYAGNKQYARMKGIVEQLLPIMERQKEELAFMPEDEQEWINLKGPDYKTAE